MNSTLKQFIDNILSYISNIEKEFQIIIKDKQLSKHIQNLKIIDYEIKRIVSITTSFLSNTSSNSNSNSNTYTLTNPNHNNNNNNTNNIFQGIKKINHSNTYLHSSSLSKSKNRNTLSPCFTKSNYITTYNQNSNLNTSVLILDNERKERSNQKQMTNRSNSQNQINKSNKNLNTYSNHQLLSPNLEKNTDKSRISSLNERLIEKEKEVSLILEENKRLKQVNLSMRQENDYKLKEFEEKIENFIKKISFDRENHKENLIKTEKLQEEIKNLTYQKECLEKEYLKSENNLELTIKKVNSTNNKLKSENEHILKVNSELSEKLIELEMENVNFTRKTQKNTEKTTILMKRIDELSNEKAYLQSEIDNRDYRLKSLRQMNDKLDNNSRRLLKKYDSIQLLESQFEETYSNYKKQLKYTEEQTKKIINLRSDNESYAKYEAQQKKEIYTLKEENRIIKKQNNDLKSMNEEVNKRCEALENKIKSNYYANNIKIDSQPTGQIANSNMSQLKHVGMSHNFLVNKSTIEDDYSKMKPTKRMTSTNFSHTSINNLSSKKKENSQNLNNSSIGGNATMSFGNNVTSNKKTDDSKEISLIVLNNRRSVKISGNLKQKSPTISRND